MKNIIQQAITELKTNKYPGSWQTHSETPKFVDENNIDIVVKLFNKFYTSKNIPIPKEEQMPATIRKKELSS